MRATNTAIAAASLSRSFTSSDPRQSGASVFGCTADTIFTRTQSMTTTRYAFLNGSSGVITGFHFTATPAGGLRRVRQFEHLHFIKTAYLEPLPPRHPPLDPPSALSKTSARSQ